MAADSTVFVRNFRQQVEAAKANLRACILEGVQDVAERIITTTPVRTGFLRGSWYSTLNAPLQKDGKADKAGVETLSAISLAVVGAELGDTIYLLNGASYARRVEYGFAGEDGAGRTYNQSGSGLVRLAVSEAPAIFAEAIKRVAAGGGGGANPGGGGAVGGRGYVE